MTSNKKRVFDLWLSKLNENSYDITFGGNCMFQFNRAGTYDFEIISLNEDALDYTQTEYVPVVDIQEIEAPFVEKNERTDLEREFYIAVKVERTRDATTGKMVIEFDDTDDRYQAVLETIETIRDELTFVDDEGYKNTFKIRQPNRGGVFKWNGNHYLILTVSMNLTSLKYGFFGNETKVYFGLKSDTSFGQTSDYELDVREFSETTSKEMDVESYLSSDEVTKKANKRSYSPTITCNFNGSIPDILVYKEKALIADINTTYQMTVSNDTLNTFASEDLDYTVDVRIATINMVYKNNKVDEYTITLERA